MPTSASSSGGILVASEGWQVGNLELVVQDEVDEVRRDAVDQDARAEAAYQRHDALRALRAGRRTWAAVVVAIGATGTWHRDICDRTNGG